MRAEQPAEAGEPAHDLSILYLRCGTYEATKKADEFLEPFNSLFEMHDPRRRRSRQGGQSLSILYLRCGGLKSSELMPHSLLLSILYLRCVPEEDGILRRLCRPFNSLFEMLVK